ncbi:MAG: class I SAM-dependent methyltransferase [Treponema sp.]|nr:class I SAM-dependent methyltransferase [Treponema sp.]
MSTTCNICSQIMSVHDKAQILNKYTITYYYCSNCGFLQTEKPYWLDESYSKAIARSDTGIMIRNMANATDLLFFLKYIPQGACLDFGGGHGILTRIMRDYGFDFFHYDKYAENLFSAGFEGNLNSRYELVTSFENFEHFSSPLDEIEKLLQISDTIYFTTLLLPSPPPPIIDWWYYAPREGQHISFFSLKTLQVIAYKYDCQLLSNNSNLHILTKKIIRTNIFSLLKRYNKIRNKLDYTRLFKKKSKTWDDMLEIVKNENSIRSPNI